jgi:hypothetical protein
MLSGFYSECALHSCPRETPALRNNDFAAAEKAGIQRDCSGPEQNQRERHHRQVQGQQRIAMPVSVRGKKPANAHSQVPHGCRSACDRRQESGQEKKPSKDRKKSDDANDKCRAAQSSESSESTKTLHDRTQGHRDAQKDKPEAWPSGRESRK